jgi:hypothetical protein
VRVIRRLITVTAAAACLLGVAGPVTAQEFVQHDRRGDLSRILWDSDVAVPAPGRRYADVVRTSYAHRRTDVVVRASFVELAPAGTLFGGVETRTSQGRRVFTVMATRGSRDGFLFQGRKQKCRVGIRIDYAGNDLRVAVPRTCLGDPSWVQVRFGASVLRRDGDEIIDNAGAPRWTGSSPHPWSPRLRVGRP